MSCMPVVQNHRAVAIENDSHHFLTQFNRGLLFAIYTVLRFNSQRGCSQRLPWDRDDLGNNRNERGQPARRSSCGNNSARNQQGQTYTAPTRSPLKCKTTGARCLSREIYVSHNNAQGIQVVTRKRKSEDPGLPGQ